MKLMLHICCAPCSVAIVDKLINIPEIELSGFFYNPNIHPEEEYIKRREAVNKMASDYGIPVTFQNESGLEYWKNNLSREKEVRCRTCYSLRLDRIAREAKEKGFDAFSTSLLISPYQDHELIRKIAEDTANRYGLLFYYEDFRELYYKGKNLSRAKGYYMQKFCGCMYSYSESDHPKKPIYIFE
ncbi:MAG: epoxyqueuosine reductase QueH [Clostridiaceae bacterium]|nr:epoxyqueuosine reductase QueH [Clostridiaceae bacterium]